MKLINSIIFVLIAALIGACNPTTEDGSKYVGNWQTPPVPNTRAGHQYFIEIAPEASPNYLATFTRKGDVMGGNARNDKITKKYKGVFTMKEGKLVSERGGSIYLDSQGVLHYNNIEYRK